MNVAGAIGASLQTSSAAHGAEWLESETGRQGNPKRVQCVKRLRLRRILDFDTGSDRNTCAWILASK
jgi:hypothetical protein